MQAFSRYFNLKFFRMTKTYKCIVDLKYFVEFILESRVFFCKKRKNKIL